MGSLIFACKKPLGWETFNFSLITHHYKSECFNILYDNIPVSLEGSATIFLVVSQPQGSAGWSWKAVLKAISFYPLPQKISDI